MRIKKIVKWTLWSVFFLIAILAITTVVILNQPSFGRLPQGERLERIKKSPNYRDGKFQNMTPTVAMSSDKSFFENLSEFLFADVKDLAPVKNIPAIKTDLRQLDKKEDLLVWLGHSSLYMQINEKRILVDPVLVNAAPFSSMNKAFVGTNLYNAEDLPDADYLIITHDHWDHLEYSTILNLKDRVGKVICPLGVGEHLEYWGVDKNRIIELDWNESTELDNGMVLNALPARHFSGRGLTADKTLWASYMLQSPSGNIFICGDSGYDNHFMEIKNRFGNIKLAIMENGQYNEDWKYIHMLPNDLVKAVKDLQPERLFTVHNSKYALGRHAWYEPLDNISKASDQNGFNLITPMIGETVNLMDTTQTFSKWWKKQH